MIFHIYPVSLLHCTVLGKGPWSYRTSKNHDTVEPRVKATLGLLLPPLLAQTKADESVAFLFKEPL